MLDFIKKIDCLFVYLSVSYTFYKAKQKTLCYHKKMPDLRLLLLSFHSLFNRLHRQRIKTKEKQNAVQPEIYLTPSSAAQDRPKNKSLICILISYLHKFRIPYLKLVCILFIFVYIMMKFIFWNV